MLSKILNKYLRMIATKEAKRTNKKMLIRDENNRKYYQPFYRYNIAKVKENIDSGYQVLNVISPPKI